MCIYIYDWTYTYSVYAYDSTFCTYMLSGTCAHIRFDVYTFFTRIEYESYIFFTRIPRLHLLYTYMIQYTHAIPRIHFLSLQHGTRHAWSGNGKRRWKFSNVRVLTNGVSICDMRHVSIQDVNHVSTWDTSHVSTIICQKSKFD